MRGHSAFLWKGGISVKEEQGRRLHLELLRMIAIYLVVLNHTGYNGYL